MLDADVNASLKIRDRAKGVWGDASKVQIAYSTELLMAAQAKPKRSFRKKKESKENTTGGCPAQACSKRGGFFHEQGRNRGRQRTYDGAKAPTRSSALQGRE